MKAAKNRNKNPNPNIVTVDLNEIGVYIEALRRFAQEMDTECAPHKRLFLQMLADRLDIAIGEEPTLNPEYPSLGRLVGSRQEERARHG